MYDAISNFVHVFKFTPFGIENFKVDLGGDKEKLLVVRDLSPLVNLQKQGYQRQHLHIFTEKVIKLISESSENSSKNLQKLETFVDSNGKLTL